MRYFNTSGPNIPLKHYTIERKKLMVKGVELVKDERYFTIWAPRQTGKSTYFRQLADELEKQGYKVAHINFENFKKEKAQTFINSFKRNINEFWGTDYQFGTIPEFFELVQTQKQGNNVLIIDEVEGINPEYFGEFLHSIRNAYHSRENHCLKSVIFVGVSNIVGVVGDNASPFNISDNLNVPYFTVAEVHELLLQHETETGQLFNENVKNKICGITANQPGLVNGFAKKLVDDCPGKKEITYDDYLEAEHWYLNVAIDKNFANILNKAKEYRSFVETLLFTENKIPFQIDRESIKILYTNGLIREDGDGFVDFWVPFYKKRLYSAFYPYTNGEQEQVSRTIVKSEYFNENGHLLIEKLINTYKEFVKRRGFGVFREKNERGEYKSIKEAALIYSFETFITATMHEIGGKIYREANTGLGKSDMIINAQNTEIVIETKIFYSPGRFTDGKGQLAYYCNSVGINKGIYLVFCPNNIPYPENIKEQKEFIGDSNVPGQTVEIMTYIVPYDEDKW